MNNSTFIKILAILSMICQQILSQTYIINGKIKALNGEEIPFANCHELISKKGTVSDPSGNYTLFVNNNKGELKFSAIGFKAKNVAYNLQSDTTINITLSIDTLQEVTVIAERAQNTKYTAPGLERIDIKKLNNLPSIGGQKDIIKSLTFLPAVSTGKEGKNDLMVRGGNRDQNLILLDNAPLYSSNHLGGFLSTINSDVIRTMNFYKGGFPARYGNKASSVMDIVIKDASPTQWQAKISPGLITSGFVLSGPIIKNKTTLLLSGRASYIHLFNRIKGADYDNVKKLEMKIDSMSGDGSAYNFSDFNVKMKHRFNDKNSISYSYYRSYDRNAEYSMFSFYNQAIKNLKETNKIPELHVFNHTSVINPSLSIKNTLYYTACKQKSEEIYQEKSYFNHTYELKEIQDQLTDKGLKSELKYLIKAHTLRTGIEINSISNNAGTIHFSEKEYIQNTSYDTTYQIISNNNYNQIALYIEDEINLNNHSLTLGLRAPRYKTEKIFFQFIEPRFTHNYHHKNTSFKSSYTRINQALHGMYNNFSGFEQESYIAITPEIKPLQSDLITSGIFYETPRFEMIFGMDFFYKEQKDLIYFQRFETLDKTVVNWQNQLYKGGRGKIYGMELSAEKRTNKLFIYTAYTLMWNYRKFDGINNGNYYPYLYDRRHSFTSVFQYDLSEAYSISFTFNLSSGHRTTLPNAYVSESGYGTWDDYYSYNELNSDLMPIYHRADIMTQKHWRSKRWGLLQHFNVSVYNLYARKNPLYAYVSNGKMYQKSLFTIIPSISYEIEF